MKKLLCILLSIISAVGIAFAFVGCGENEGYGQFYNLQNAYDNGLLSKDDLIHIAAIYNGEVQCTETLDGETELLIKNCKVERLRNDSNHPIAEATTDDVKIVKFYGKYSDCYVVSLDDIYTAYPANVLNEWFYIDGIGFHRTGHFGITVWVNEK